MRKVSKSMWLRRVGPLSLAGALVLPLALDGAETPKPAAVSKQQEYLEANKSAKQKFFDDLESRRSAAMLKAGEGGAENYSAAIKDLEKLAAILKETSGEIAREQLKIINGNIVRINAVWGSELMQEAQQLAKAKQFEAARQKAQEAYTKSPDQKYIPAFIEECDKYIRAAQYKEETSREKVAPGHDEKLKSIDIEMREAKILFRNKRYEAVCSKLERILVVDPFNVDAVELLALTYDHLYQMGVDRSLESIAIENARNTWEWSEPVMAIQRDDSTDGSAVERKVGTNDMQTRLEGVVLPAVPLNDSNLDFIINFLNMEIHKHYPDLDLTIIPRLSEKERAKTIPFNIPGEMSLNDILRYLSLISGVPYSFQNGNVIFGDTDNMIVERFSVRNDIINELIQSKNVISTDSGMTGPEEGGGGGDNAPADGGEEPPPMLDEVIPGDAGAGAGAPVAGAGVEGQAVPTVATTKTVSPQELSTLLKEYFSERMVSFENGASIIYSPRSEQLIVKNTPENLRRLDNLLRQMDKLEKPMIMVEAKLIELTDTNLNELGFEWMFSAQPASGKGWNMGTVDPTRHGNNGAMFRVLNNLKVLPNFGEKIFGSDVKVDLSLSINAVAQNRRAEVLASPRILSESDPKQPAKIQMTEKTYFITEWEQPDVETDGFNITVDSTDPDWDDAYDLGVTFTVQPAVMSDNYTISLKNINPVFLSHVADYHYVVSYEAGIYEKGMMTPMMTQTFDLRMPEIARREMTTSITLYDGETVLIGGMADNESSNREDKWPILGDIPLLGRLFQDHQSNVTNRTMLIFITARLVNSNGVPMRSVRDRGLIEFNR